MSSDQMHNKYLLAGTYQDLAGNVGAGDVNATVAVSVLSTDTTDSTTTSSSSKLSSGDMAGIIIGCIIGAVFLALMCCLVSQRCLVMLHVYVRSLMFHQLRYRHEHKCHVARNNQAKLFLSIFGVNGFASRYLSFFTV